MREDCEGGDAWSYFSHDQARSRAYSWGEDRIAGIGDKRQPCLHEPAAAKDEPGTSCSTRRPFARSGDELADERLYVGLDPWGSHFLAFT